MLYFRYGNYRFPAGAVSFSTSAQRLYTPRGLPYSIRRTMDLKYEMQAATPALLTAQITALNNALVHGRDLGLYEEDGGPTAHVWRNSETHGGIRVTSDGNPVGDGTEYVTFRTIDISFEADFPIRGFDPLMSATETVTIVGDGGPEEVYIPVLRGKWPKQQVSERSLVTATQAGEIVFWGRQPELPRPIWPASVIRSKTTTTRTSPTITGGERGEYKLAYSYSFQSNEPLIGSPREV